MALDPTRKLDRFLRRLCRRGWGLRILEMAGIGVLVAAAGAMIAVAVMFARHQSAEIAVAAMLAGGLVTGGLIGLARRPSRLHVAMAADRQLHLPQLISSAAAMPPGAASDPLDRELRQMLAERAADQCSGKSYRRIRLRRFGANRWAAIALGAGIPILLGTLTSPRPPLSSRGAEVDRPVAVNDPDDAPLVQLADSAAGPRQEMNPDERVNGSQRPDTFSQPSEQPTATPSGNADNRPGPSPMGGPSDNSTGSGNSRTHVEQQPSDAPTDVPLISAPPPLSGPNIGGVGLSATTPPSGDVGRESGGMGSAADFTHTAPWRSAAWAATADAAQRQVESGQIPSAYRELVRDYFSPNGDD
jgi:hypothetical protein